jgi:hypothetical protein
MTAIDRPTQITTILKTVDSHVRTTLEAYMSKLEARQEDANHTLFWDPNNPPVWSQARSDRRDYHRRERALNKRLHNYR